MWRDSKSGYGIVSIALHWTGALLIIAIWILGNNIEDAPRGPARIDARNLHFAVAIISMIVIAPRLLWRFGNYKTPLVKTSQPWLDLLAKVVKWALLLSIVTLLVTGPLDVWSGRAAAIDIFGFSVPSPLPPSVSQAIHPFTGNIHKITSKIILALVGLHVLGALKHVVIDRDGVLWRMFVPTKI